MLVLNRLRLAITTLPTVAGYLFTLLLFALYAALSLVIIRQTGLFQFRHANFSRSQVAIIVIVAFFSPSLLEELVYRAALLPHPLEKVPSSQQVAWALVSLGLYVLSHPLIAWTVWPWSRPIFYRASFLTIVTLLGVSCTVSYYLTGSIWPPVVMHWLTIVSWKLFFGGPDFGFAGSRSA